MLQKVYLVEKLNLIEDVWDVNDDNDCTCTEELYIFGTLDKAQKFVGEQVTEIRERFHYDLEQVHVNETYFCGETTIGDYIFVIKEMEVR